MNRQDAICLLVIILVIVGIISALGYSWYSDVTKKGKSKSTSELIAREGDLVKLDFTEYILLKDEEGRPKYYVYQTTLEEVATDETIPKSVTFGEILINETGEPITREPISAIVGADLAEEVNPGFNKLLIKLGMREGETKSGTVYSSEGYGERNESLILTIPFNDKISMYETFDRVDFESRYSNELPFESGKIFESHYWSWDIRIISKTDETITIKNEPTLGMELDIFEWNVTVSNISSSSGLIWLRHMPDENLVNIPIHAEQLEFYNSTFRNIKDQITESQQPYPGIISTISTGVTIDFNRENIGKNLKYDIKLIEITRD